MSLDGAVDDVRFGDAMLVDNGQAGHGMGPWCPGKRAAKGMARYSAAVRGKAAGPAVSPQGWRALTRRLLWWLKGGRTGVQSTQCNVVEFPSSITTKGARDWRCSRALGGRSLQRHDPCNHPSATPPATSAIPATIHIPPSHRRRSCLPTCIVDGPRDNSPTTPSQPSLSRLSLPSGRCLRAAAVRHPRPLLLAKRLRRPIGTAPAQLPHSSRRVPGSSIDKSSVPSSAVKLERDVGALASPPCWPSEASRHVPEPPLGPARRCAC